MFVKVRSRQRKHNLNRNYNLMGFDTIEINLVYHLKLGFFVFLKMIKILGLNHTWLQKVKYLLNESYDLYETSDFFL